MMKNQKVRFELKKIKAISLAAMLIAPLFAFSQTKDTKENEKRPEVSYKQRHSRAIQNKDLYADGIKIKKDLSLIDKAQEGRILDESEVPADELYGSIWNNRYVNTYGSIENAPDNYSIDLKNFSMPTMGYITSNFGPRRRRMHYGVDLKVHVGDTIYAAFDGKIRVCQYERRGYGYYVVIRHHNGLETIYGHLSGFLVSEDDVVKSGQPIGLGGNTGRSTGPHLHFETRFLGKPINPSQIIDFDNKICHKDTYVVSPGSFSKSGSRNAYNLARNSSKKSGGNKYATKSSKYYKIKKGDTLATIARRHGVSVKKLCSMNNMNQKSTLRPGKSLKVS